MEVLHPPPPIDLSESETDSVDAIPQGMPFISALSSLEEKEKELIAQQEIERK